ncbi:hypothetical protein RN22_08645 [Grimontia sp. AD028]|nr:hypothetical protein RN22_08645 [Grimontia sp. AD028]
MKNTYNLAAWILPQTLAVIFCLASAPAFADWRKGAGYMELADRLDRSQDGYCFDLPGAGEWVDTSAPVNAHNCKVPGFYPDGAVTFASPGQIRFPAYGLCLTATGLNGRSLPGAALLVRHCADQAGQSNSFLASESGLQIFVHRDDGRIELGRSGLCIAVGNRSDSTYSSSHRWRPLFLAECKTINAGRSVWKPFQPKSDR